MSHILDYFTVQAYVLIDSRLISKAMMLVHCRLTDFSYEDTFKTRTERLEF